MARGPVGGGRVRDIGWIDGTCGWEMGGEIRSSSEREGGEWDGPGGRGGGVGEVAPIIRAVDGEAERVSAREGGGGGRLPLSVDERGSAAIAAAAAAAAKAIGMKAGPMVWYQIEVLDEVDPRYVPSAAMASLTTSQA